MTCEHDLQGDLARQLKRDLAETRGALLDLYTLIHDMGWHTPNDRYHSITRAAAALKDFAT